MRTIGLAGVVFLPLVLAACGRDPAGDRGLPAPPQAPATSSGEPCNPALHGLILHPPPQEGISGEYIVVLDGTQVSDASAEAARLAGKYGGQVRFVYRSAPFGFAGALDDVAAPTLATEPTVCYVEQNVLVHGT